MNGMVADTHVHIYPCYDFPAALASLVANLARLAAGEAVSAAFFTERHDCRAFASLQDGSLPAAGRDLEVRSLEEGAVLLATGGGAEVYLFAGRQLVTAERIEVLAVAMPADLPDGQPALKMVEAVLAAGGVPVIGWSPGKWSLSRGHVVRELLRRFKPGDLLLGDTALRPTPCPEPRLMREARRRGLAVIAGSDPLPLPREERLLGTYATVFQGPFDAAQPLESARRLLRSPAAVVGTRGARSSWPVFASRWSRLAFSRQIAT